MMKGKFIMKTRFISIILAALMIIPAVLLISCGETVSYSADIAVSDLAVAAGAVLPESDKYTNISESYITNRMELDLEGIEDFAVKINVIDEYGIFKAPSDDDVKAIKETVEAYLNRRVEEWMPEYMPEEFPKVENATVKVFGRYVVYCILSEDAKTDVFTAVENTLLGK